MHAAIWNESDHVALLAPCAPPALHRRDRRHGPANSSSELAVRVALQAAETAGAETVMFDGPALLLPLYDPTDSTRTEGAMSSCRPCGPHTASSSALPDITAPCRASSRTLDYTEDWRATGTTLSSPCVRWSMPCAAGTRLSASRSTRAEGVRGGSVRRRGRGATLTVLWPIQVVGSHMRRDAAALLEGFISDEKRPPARDRLTPDPRIAEELSSSRGMSSGMADHQDCGPGKPIAAQIAKISSREGRPHRSSDRRRLASGGRRDAQHPARLDQVRVPHGRRVRLHDLGISRPATFP